MNASPFVTWVTYNPFLKNNLRVTYIISEKKKRLNIYWFIIHIIYLFFNFNLINLFIYCLKVPITSPFLFYFKPQTHFLWSHIQYFPANNCTPWTSSFESQRSDWSITSSDPVACHHYEVLVSYLSFPMKFQTLFFNVPLL